MEMRKVLPKQVQQGFWEKAQMSRKGEHLSFFGTDNGWDMVTIVGTAVVCK